MIQSNTERLLFAWRAKACAIAVSLHKGYNTINIQWMVIFLLQEDWIMRQIENMVSFLTTIVLKHNSTTIESLESSAQTNDIREELEKRIQNGDIGGAENLLFEKMEKGNDAHLKLAIDFYKKLNTLDDKTLEDGGFSRQEIEEGLRDAADFFGVTVL